MFEERIQQMQLEEARLNVEAAKVRLDTAMKIQQNVMIAALPSRSMPVTVKRSGSNWVCLLETSDNYLDCVIAYGSSPIQAMLNFDNLFLGIGTELDEPEDYEEY